jgi:hypothetical protein
MSDLEPLKFKTWIRQNKSDEFLQLLSAIELFHQHVHETTEAHHLEFPVSAVLTGGAAQASIHFFQLLYAQYLLKYNELVGGLIEAANSHQFIVFGLCGRTLIEVTATLRYYHKKIVPVIQEAVASGVTTDKQWQEILSSLDKHARGGRFNWQEFWFGDRKKFAFHLVESAKNSGKKKNSHVEGEIQKQPNPEQVNALTAINQWAEEAPSIQLSYSFFCELVHPNLGSNFLVMGSKDGNLVLGGGVKKSIAMGLCEVGIELLVDVIRETSLQMSHLVLLKESKI